MATITLNVNREDVYAEVDKTTDYTGTKLIENDPKARDRIAATQTDLNTLSRLWEEACVTANERLREMHVESSLPSAENYSVKLQVSVAFDTELKDSIEATLRSFFITLITGKWYVLSNKGDAAAYFTEAGALMEDVRRKLYTRRMIRSPRKAKPNVEVGKPSVDPDFPTPSDKVEL